MDQPSLILITDRNRHVRDLLRRELTAAGYRIKLAKDGGEVLEGINGNDLPDLVVLDLDIPYAGSFELVEKIGASRPDLPVVVHTLYTEYAQHPSLKNMAAFIEKSGNIEALIKKIEEIIGRKTKPAGSAASEGETGDDSKQEREE